MAANGERGIGDNQPPAGEAIAARLAADYTGTEETAKALLDKARALPTTVADDEQLGAFAQSIRDLREHLTRVETIRVAEKEPYLHGGKAVDGWFGALKDRLAKAVKILSMRVDDYQAEKIARERKALEKIAEAERAAFEESARREAELAAYKKTSEPEQARASLDAKIAQQQAAMAQMRAAASDAELGRQHFASGGMVTAKREPDVEVLDWDAVPLDMLRPYIRRDEILKAIKAWARAKDYAEQMPGVRIEIRSKAVVR
jgi:hypothetical protein